MTALPLRVSIGEHVRAQVQRRVAELGELAQADAELLALAPGAPLFLRSEPEQASTAQDLAGDVQEGAA